MDPSLHYATLKKHEEFPGILKLSTFLMVATLNQTIK